MNNISCSLFQSFGHYTYSHSRRNRDQLDLPCKKDPKARYSTASNSPKEIFSHSFSVEDLAFCID
ncbi:hypothetical protein Sjap_018145 [Stephania japonica]|uniref:Uncharacterized protein n=1 Tax=Stephania japonica TaxID=461633 RepID=A0AAP0I7K3_9MAGN